MEYRWHQISARSDRSSIFLALSRSGPFADILYSLSWASYDLVHTFGLLVLCRSLPSSSMPPKSARAGSSASNTRRLHCSEALLSQEQEGVSGEEHKPGDDNSSSLSTSAALAAPASLSEGNPPPPAHATIDERAVFRHKHFPIPTSKLAKPGTGPYQGNCNECNRRVATCCIGCSLKIQENHSELAQSSKGFYYLCSVDLEDEMKCVARHLIDMS